MAWSGQVREVPNNKIKAIVDYATWNKTKTEQPCTRAHRFVAKGRVSINI